MYVEHLGYLFTVEHIRGGRVLSVERIHNLIPIQGRDYLLSVGAAAGAQIATFYCGLFEGNYTPLETDTMATFPASSTESTAYTETTRPEWIEAAPAAGAISNTASKAVFTINATKTFYGALLSSSPVKGGVAGTLLSAARFSTSKTMDNAEVLRVTGTITSITS